MQKNADQQQSLPDPSHVSAKKSSGQSATTPVNAANELANPPVGPTSVADSPKKSDKQVTGERVSRKQLRGEKTDSEKRSGKKNSYQQNPAVTSTVPPDADTSIAKKERQVTRRVIIPKLDTIVAAPITKSKNRTASLDTNSSSMPVTRPPSATDGSF